MSKPTYTRRVLAFAAASACLACASDANAIQPAAADVFLFKKNSLQLEDRSAKQLQEFVESGGSHSSSLVRQAMARKAYLCVNGHAAKDETNGDLLSLQRAKLIEAAFVRAGVPAALLYTSSFGAAKPMLPKQGERGQSAFPEMESAVEVNQCFDATPSGQTQ